MDNLLTLEAMVDHVAARTKELHDELLVARGYELKDHFIPKGVHGECGRRAMIQAILEEIGFK